MIGSRLRVLCLAEDLGDILLECNGFGEIAQDPIFRSSLRC